MRRNDTPGRIVKNVCTDVGVHDVITCADLYYDRLRGLGVAGGQILGFSIDLLRRPYNTRSTVRVNGEVNGETQNLTPCHAQTP